MLKRMAWVLLQVVNIVTLWCPWERDRVVTAGACKQAN
jgi:hypothetical protein